MYVNEFGQIKRTNAFVAGKVNVRAMEHFMRNYIVIHTLNCYHEL